MVVGALTNCVLLHSMCNLKATQMNMQCSVMWELMYYELEVAHDAMEATKNICFVKG